MKIFIDSADVDEIKKYLSWGVCDGVTTNPSIFLKCGVTGGIENMKQKAVEIARLIAPRYLSVEVISDDPKEILSQARDYAKIADNIAVKITITDRRGDSLLPVIRKLVSEGVGVNVTAMMTFNQAILASKAISAGRKLNPNANKPCYISIFAGRISEEHGVDHARRVLSDIRNWLDSHNMSGIEIIVGSVRTPENLESWAKTGAHIMTLPPAVIAKSLLAAKTKEAVARFIEDAEKTMSQI